MLLGFFLRQDSVGCVDVFFELRDAIALPCGHYLSEEAPEETYRELRAFFAVHYP